MNYLIRSTLLAFLLAVPVFAEDPLAAPVNLNFEAGAPGVPPTGWEVSPPSEGATAETVAEGCPEGARCARLTRKDTSPGYSALGEVVRAEAYRGKRIRLRGTLRLAGGAGRSLLYLQVNRSASEHATLIGQVGARGARRRLRIRASSGVSRAASTRPTASIVQAGQSSRADSSLGWKHRTSPTRRARAVRFAAP